MQKMSRQIKNAELSNKAVTPMVDQSVSQQLAELTNSFPTIETRLHQAPGDFMQANTSQLEKLPKNFNVIELIAYFQKLKLEEQRLIDIKQQLLSKQNDLQNIILREIEKTKEAITNLNSELPDLQNKTKLLEEATAIDISSQTQELKANLPINPANKHLAKPNPECAGLLKCLKPETCQSYHYCLNMYMAAEIRNSVTRF
jgi:hypothetical protein